MPALEAAEKAVASLRKEDI